MRRFGPRRKDARRNQEAVAARPRRRGGKTRNRRKASRKDRRMIPTTARAQKGTFSGSSDSCGGMGAPSRTTRRPGPSEARVTAAARAAAKPETTTVRVDQKTTSPTSPPQSKVWPRSSAGRAGSMDTAPAHAPRRLGTAKGARAAERQGQRRQGHQQAQNQGQGQRKERRRQSQRRRRWRRKQRFRRRGRDHDCRRRR